MTPAKQALLHNGAFIVAHPLALTEERKLDERRQHGLSRYYLEAGADGLAVGVHTTQFAIRQAGLYEPVLRLAAETVADVNPNALLVAGAVGPVEQACAEAETAKRLGYDAVLLSCGGLPQLTEKELIDRAKRVSAIMPLFGFYLQPAAGGRLLSAAFWRDLSSLPGLVAIKMAPFNRYQTLDVIRGVCESGRADDIALYTGNDDNIVADFLTTFEVEANGVLYKKRIVGGLLGHWAAWTKPSVDIYRKVKAVADSGGPISPELLTLAAQVTESNAALFDAANGYKGCIPGVHEVLRRAGYLDNLVTLDPDEKLSPGQTEELDRIEHAYPFLCVN